ncbi:biotin transporter BioY [Effusibacillus dendaii]|uniref:Biotin transporter n=1 Tax=Effusibacillus dendaii TaxID=2743772 RepID=A0A7I8DFX9_9BACL|nr:biotin transporter BioY [Effusibacillus dendaii]BCJ86781.1 biotin transporter BioY [Effusibacillus dendaii]
MAKWTIRGLVFSALFAAITGALSYLKITLPFSPVPITFSTFGIMLAGSILGARYGFLSMLLVVILEVAGIPLLEGIPGVARIYGPTGGFLLAYPVAALLIGLFVERIKPNRWLFGKLSIVNFLFGSLFLYPSGVAWLAHIYHFSLAKALAAGFWPFLPGDILKSLLCAAITVAVWRVYPVERVSG